MNERLREALRRRIAQHNRLVGLSTLVSLAAVVLMWGALYFVAWWLSILGATVVQGLEAEAPEGFNRVVAITFCVWFVAGWIARWRKFFDRPRLESAAGTKFLELLLTPPRATLAALANIRNRVRLNEDDLIAATDFLVRVVRAGKLPLTMLPVELPDETRRGRVLAGLQLLDLIYVRTRNDIPFVVVCHPQRLVKFLDPAPAQSRS